MADLSNDRSYQDTAPARSFCHPESLSDEQIRFTLEVRSEIRNGSTIVLGYLVIAADDLTGEITMRFA